MTFILSTGHISDKSMTAISQSLSSFWGVQHKEFSCNDSPVDTLKKIKSDNGIFQLNGDPARLHGVEGTWIEALGVWKKNTLFVCKALPDGSIPGVSAAYVSLAKEFSLPLLGIIQYCGNWDQQNRVLDGLPWCGHLTENIEDSNQIGYLDEMDKIQSIVFYLKKKIKFLL
tara:strand:- start:69 stop:581 length:513 start_codon:yes stop_codon:yes gene_type:complete